MFNADEENIEAISSTLAYTPPQDGEEQQEETTEKNNDEIEAV